MAKTQTSRPATVGNAKRGRAGGDMAGRDAISGEFVTVGPRGHEVVRIKVKAAAPVRAGRHYVLLDDPSAGVANTDGAFEPGPWAQAMLRGREGALADLKSCGGAYDLDQVRAMLGDISRSQVHAKVKERKLLAVPGPSNHRHYPVVQFNARGELIEGIKEVQEALDDSPWIVLNFLIHPDARLQGRKPIDLLAEGKVDMVAAAARRLGAAGA